MVVQPAEPASSSISRAVWGRAALLAGLFLAAHYWQPMLLIPKWMHDPNWSHGFLIPLFSIYLLYARREDLFSAPRRKCLAGLGIMVFALLGEVASVFFLRNNWIVQVNMILMLFGLVLYVGGPRIIKVTWVPIWFLVFAMPLPDRLYTNIAVPLQNLAAKSAEVAMRLSGVQIVSSASRLDVVSLGGQVYPLTVAEACSGMRSLMAFVALSVAMAYLENRPVWQRVILVTAAVPVAVLCNILRVTITCGAYVLDRPEFGKDFMHDFTGLLMLVPAFGLLWLLSKLMQAIFVEVEETDESASPPEGAKS